MPPTNADAGKVPQVIWLTAGLIALLGLSRLLGMVVGLRAVITKPDGTNMAAAGMYTGLSALFVVAFGLAAFMVVRHAARSRRVALTVVIAYPVLFFLIFAGYSILELILVAAVVVLMFRPEVRAWTDGTAPSPRRS
jgi:hypothetical protein